MAKALIFDFSDTLVNSTESRKRAFQELTQQFFGLAEEKARELLLLYWKTDLLYPHSSLKHVLKKAVQEFCIHQGVACDIDMKEFYTAYRKKVKKYECIRQSFLDIFPQLKKKYYLFILTIEPRKTVESLLQKAGIAPKEFHEIITGTELRAWDMSRIH
jgi:phosphoglycolate phosphatase-like HAD superfamily hydrolase